MANVGKEVGGRTPGLRGVREEVNRAMAARGKAVGSIAGMASGSSSAGSGSHEGKQRQEVQVDVKIGEITVRHWK